MPHREFFLIRLSAEPDHDGNATSWALRGQVEHPRTGQTWRFVRLDDLSAILSGWFNELVGEIAESSDEE